MVWASKNSRSESVSKKVHGRSREWGDSEVRARGLNLLITKFRIQMASVEAHLRVTPKTDLWSLGIIIVLLLTGEFPWIVEEDEEGLDPYNILLSILKFSGSFSINRIDSE